MTKDKISKFKNLESHLGMLRVEKINFDKEIAFFVPLVVYSLSQETDFDGISDEVFEEYKHKNQNISLLFEGGCFQEVESQDWYKFRKL